MSAEGTEARSLPDRERRPVDPARLRVELTRVGNFLYNQGIGDGAAAVDDANAELDRLRAENEALYRSWNIDAEYRDELMAALDELHSAGLALVPHIPPISAKVSIRWDDAMGAADRVLRGASDEEDSAHA